MQGLGRFHDTDRVLWTEMLSAVMTWACNRRPADEKSHWLTIAETAEADEQRQREVKRMGNTIAQAFREEGKLEGEIKGKLEGKIEMLMQLGRSRFGVPDTTIERAIYSIDNAQRLDAIAERILIAANWTDLLKN